MSEETKQKLLAVNVGRPLLPETKAKLRDANLGRKFSEGIRAKVSAAAIVREAAKRKAKQAAIVAAGILVAVGAHADQPSPLHTIPWYMRHRAERDATLAWCHVSADRSRMYDCQNAEAAGNERVLSQPMSGNFLMSAEWWRANPMVRDGVLRICANPTQPGAAVYLRYCRYAASGF